MPLPLIGITVAEACKLITAASAAYAAKKGADALYESQKNKNNNNNNR